MIYSFISIAKNAKRERERQHQDDYYDEEDEEEEEIRVPPPVPKPQIVKQATQEKESPYEFHTKLDDYVSSLQNTEGAVVKSKKKANIHELMKSLPDKKLIFLSYEVFSQPVSNRKSPFPWNG